MSRRWTTVVAGLLIVLALFYMRWSSSPSFVGRWVNDKGAAIEFFDDGQMSLGLQNGMSAAATWKVIGDGRVKIEQMWRGQLTIWTGILDREGLRLVHPNGASILFVRSAPTKRGGTN